MDAPNVCSFSETLCNGGEKCIGTDHQGATADEFNAIFKNTTSNSCYAAKSTLDVGQAKLVAKKSGGIFIYVEHIDSTLSSFVEGSAQELKVWRSIITQVLSILNLIQILLMIN